MKMNFGAIAKPLRSMYNRCGTTVRRPRLSYCSTFRVTNPAVCSGVNRIVPVTINGFSYSSPIFFQNATSEKIDWYRSRSFALRIFSGAGACPGAGCCGGGAAGPGGAAV